MDGFKGLRQNFEATKKLALERGWIELSKYTGKRYFYPEFPKIEMLRKEAFSYYPEHYKNMTKKEREEFKKTLYEKHPEVKTLWREWGMLKGSLERRSLNYRIQGASSDMSKIAMYLLDRDNTSLTEGLVMFVHDEAILIYPKEIAEQKAVEVRDLMIRAGQYTCPDVKMDAEAEIGDYWKH